MEWVEFIKVHYNYTGLHIICFRCDNDTVRNDVAKYMKNEKKNRRNSNFFLQMITFLKYVGKGGASYSSIESILE